MNRARPSETALEGHGVVAETLADLGEWELIRRLGAFAPPGQFADDAALLEEPAARDPADGAGIAGDPRAACPVGRALVVNTDVLVDGIHFSDATTAAADVGWRAAAANLSDLAAMGATEALGLTVGLVAPSSTPWPWVEGVYQGIAAALQAHGGVLLGGDCSGGAQRLLAITALGRLPAGGGPIRRGDGRPGDLLLCTGPHGLSRLGLAVLLGDPAVPTGPEPDGAATTSSRRGPPMATVASPGGGLIQRAISAHQRPVPRFDAVRALIGCRPAGMAWRVGGCDSSDGLAAATAAIARASGCGARLDRTRLPLDPAMAALPQAQTWCLNGGEDFELVLALEPAWADALIAALPGAGLIGELMDAAPGSVGWTQGGGWPADAVSGSGFQHFR